MEGNSIYKCYPESDILFAKIKSRNGVSTGYWKTINLAARGNQRELESSLKWT